MIQRAQRPVTRRNRSAASKNFEAYLKLDKARLRDQYVVIVNGQLIGKGRDIEGMLRSARRRYPRAVPFVAKVPGEDVLVLRRAFGSERNVRHLGGCCAQSPPCSFPMPAPGWSCPCTSTPARISQRSLSDSGRPSVCGRPQRTSSASSAGSAVEWPPTSSNGSTFRSARCGCPRASPGHSSKRCLSCSAVWISLSSSGLSSTSGVAFVDFNPLGTNRPKQRNRPGQGSLAHK